MRPLLGDELSARGDFFNVVIPGAVTIDGLERVEEAILFTPKVGITGKPAITPASFTYDHVFGPERDGEDVYNSVGEGLVKRALAGQVRRTRRERSQGGNPKPILLTPPTTTTTTLLFVSRSASSSPSVRLVPERRTP